MLARNQGGLLLALLLSVLITACGHRNTQTKPITKPSPPISKSESVPIAEPSPKPEATQPEAFSLLKSASWSDLDGVLKDDLTAGWNAWLTSCSTLKNKASWKEVCTYANSLQKPTNAEIIDYYTRYFNVYMATNADGSNSGLITGYYEPILKGSKTKTEQYAYPLYAQPNDLITVELSSIYPDLKYKRIRGKLEGNKLVPYYTRAEIESESSPLAGNEIVWVDDILDAFYLQIQGSGLIKLHEGGELHIGYADQNGHAYNSIGKLLVQRGELQASEASMQGIKEWARQHPTQLRELLNSNPSYVFFKELPSGLFGPLGALGVPLTAERSLAVDPKYIPLGAPIFLSTTYPNSQKPLKRLMYAQDTGGAIKNGVRADFYWGSGDNAGKMAGAMKQTGNIWVLLPKTFNLAQ